MSSTSFMWLTLLIGIGAQAGIEDVQEMLQTAAASNAAHRARLLEGCRFSTRSVRTKKTSVGLKTLASDKIEIYFAPSRWIMEVGPGNEERPWPTEVLGFNPHYGFQLKRRLKEPVWYLVDLSFDEPLRPLLQGGLSS